METPESGPADGEERMLELRPRTRSNPEGAEDRWSSTGSLNNSLASPPQTAVGNRVEGEGEAASSDSPSTSSSVTAAGNSTSSIHRTTPAGATSQLPRETVIQDERLEYCLFVRTKHKIDKRHEFALVVVNDDAIYQDSRLTRESSTAVFRSPQCHKIELPQMEKIQTIPPPFVVWTLLVFSRHAGMLQFNPSDAAKKMLQSPYFFFDVVYLHNGSEEQTEDTSWKDAYASFSELDSKGMCYRFEGSLCGPAIELHNCMAKLLCHPLQRPFQSHDNDAPENEISWMHNHRLIHSDMKEPCPLFL